MELFRGENFERFITELFQLEGFEIVKEASQGQRGPDLEAIHLDHRIFVEIKLYGSEYAPRGGLLTAARYVAQYVGHGEGVGILVVGNQINLATRQILDDRYPDLIVYDLASIVWLATHWRRLDELIAIIRLATPFSDAPSEDNQPVNILADIIAANASSREDQPVEEKAKLPCLCDEIRDIPVGLVGAKAFEEKVSEALKYLFADDLTAWSDQMRTDTGISVYDLVARVSSLHDFWSSVSHHFRSRYVIFEFKNYTNKITQREIYTTEKYLYRPALRATAFIISRLGPNDNAAEAARGALRENGKLIVNLTVDDICEMLRLKDQGDDHNAMLVQRVDEMLMRIER